MKLLLDRNIVLVECPGHEPQLFMPVLVDNSIVLQNIIFDNNAPVPLQIRPKMPVLKVAAPPNVKMAAHAHTHASNVKVKHRHKIDNSPIHPLMPMGSNSFRWVRSGCDTRTQKQNHLKDPSSPVLGPTLTPSIADIKSKKRPTKTSPKTGAKEPSKFDSVRSLFYNNLKAAQSPATPKSADDNKMPTRKSRVQLSVRKQTKTARTMCDT
ncbi:hypothetical protein ACLKA6_017407 [Drosophila palustris]